MQLIHTVYLRPINVQTISSAVIQMAPLSMKVLQLHQKLVIQKDVQAVNSVSLVQILIVVVVSVRHFICVLLVVLHEKDVLQMKYTLQIIPRIGNVEIQLNANAVVVYQLYLYGLKILLLGLQRIGTPLLLQMMVRNWLLWLTMATFGFQLTLESLGQ